LSNKIVGDVTTFTSPESRSFVPAAGPFYVFNMILRNNATGQLLAPKTDYMVEYLLPEPSMASGKEVAGLIRVINIDINSVSMDYQVIGGTHGNTVTMLQQYLADNPIAPINPVWGEIPDMQVQYPPAAHLTDMKTVFGLGPLVNVIEGVRKALLAGDQAAWGALYNYLNLRLNQEHFSIVNDVTALQRPVPAGPTAGQVLMSQSPTPETYGWGDYVPIPPGSAKVLISTGAARGDWVWGDPSAALLPTPPASGQVLLSTGNMPGDWDWSPSGIEPRFDVMLEPGVVSGNTTNIVIRPMRSGKIWVGGKNHLFPTIEIVNITGFESRTLLSIFLHWNGTDLTYEIYPITDMTSLPRKNSTGLVVKYDRTTGVFDDSYTFLGHAYRNTSDGTAATYDTYSWYDPSYYKNMAKLYVRSYYNDVGTTANGFITPSTPWHTESRPHTRNGRPHNTARLLGYDHNGTSGPISDWGVGSEDQFIPLQSNVASPNITTPVPSHPDLILGYIVWPFETLRVRGQFNYGITASYGQIGIRTRRAYFNVFGLSGETVLDHGHVGGAGTAGYVTTYGVATIESIHHTDAAYYRETQNEGPILGDFRLFDMVWVDGIILYGVGGEGGPVNTAGCTRLTVEPTSYNRCLSETLQHPGVVQDSTWRGAPYY
jgi:hypothetical protein